MRLFKYIWLILGVTFLPACEGKPGPTGPSGSNGSPAPVSYEASFQNGVFPTSSYSSELDTWLNGGAQGTIENASPYLEINTGADYSNYARTLVRFDVSSLPVNASILSAELLLTSETATNVGASPVTIGLHNLASDTFAGCPWISTAYWNGTGLTSWNICTGDSSSEQEGYINPTTMSTVVLTSTNNGKSQVFKWDIDPAVIQSWLTSSVNNNGLVLKSEGEFGETASTVGFYPYNDATASTHAQLIVSYK